MVGPPPPPPRRAAAVLLGLLLALALPPTALPDNLVDTATAHKDALEATVGMHGCTVQGASSTSDVRMGL